MEYKAWFECINKCGEKYDLTDIVYECKKCGALLEVVHDEKALAATSAQEWKEHFHERRGSTVWPYGSGVWNKKEVVLPGINPENIISMCEGNTNLFWAKRFGQQLGLNDLWIKQCGVTHTGSFKDLGMTVLVSQVNDMIQNGKKIKAVACASTGDTSAALSAYSSWAGIPSIVFLPNNKISIAQLIQPVSNGSHVISLDTDFDGCMKIVKEVTKDNNIYLANSMNSLRIEGQKTIAFEICQQFNWEIPDFIIIPGGNLGNVSALGKGLKEMKAMGLINSYPTLVVAQAENANPLYKSFLDDFKSFKSQTAKTTQASAIQIGDPVSLPKAISVLKELNGIVEDASEQELADAAALGDSMGMFNCPHTGVALAALIKLVNKNVIKKEHRVVVISTAHGLKFSKFKVDYHENKTEDFSGKYRNAPHEIEASVDKVQEILESKVFK
jgi:threonine synthase